MIRRDLKNAVAPGFMIAGPLQSGAFQGGVDANDGIQIYTTTGLLTPKDIGEGAEKSGKVTVYYTEEAGRKVARFFKKTF